MIKYKAFLLVFLFSVFVSADIQKNNWKVKVVLYKSVDVLKVYDLTNKSKTPIMEFNAEGVDSGFKAAEEIYFESTKKKFLVTRWNHGGHSETLRIFDPSNKANPLQFEMLSTWPVDFKVQGDRLLINVPFEKYDGDLNPDSVMTEWVPEIKASAPSTSRAPKNP